MAITRHNLRNTIILKAAFVACMSLPVTALSDVIGFHFTGNLMVTDPFDGIIFNGTEPLTPISADLSYDTASGVGGSNLSIQISGGFWESPATFHDISLEHDTGSNTIRGNILVDWNGNFDMPMHIDWDATGLLTAIDIGLEVGDVISGAILTKASSGQTYNVFSADPYSDTILMNNAQSPLEGPAPLAATSASLGLGYDINGRAGIPA